MFSVSVFAESSYEMHTFCKGTDKALAKGRFNYRIYGSDPVVDYLQKNLAKNNDDVELKLLITAFNAPLIVGKTDPDGMTEAVYNKCIDLRVARKVYGNDSQEFRGMLDSDLKF